MFENRKKESSIRPFLAHPAGGQETIFYLRMALGGGLLCQYLSKWEVGGECHRGRRVDGSARKATNINNIVGFCMPLGNNLVTLFCIGLGQNTKNQSALNGRACKEVTVQVEGRRCFVKRAMTRVCSIWSPPLRRKTT